MPRVRSPAGRQNQAIILGSVAAIVIRVILTVFAVKLLSLPSLKFIGCVLLFWIAVKLLLPVAGEGTAVKGNAHLIAAIKIILIADIVMSLDNVLDVAAAAKGNLTLLILGLAISIPLIVIGSPLILKLIERFPLIITLGAALLGYISGELLVIDPLVDECFELNLHFVHIFIPIGGALAVVALGKWLSRATLNHGA